jgi:hypothetical protein
MYVPRDLVLKIVALCEDIEVRMAFGVVRKVEIAKYANICSSLRNRYHASSTTVFGDLENRVVICDRVCLYFNKAGNEMSSYFFNPGLMNVRAMTRSSATEYADAHFCMTNDTYPQLDCKGVSRRPSSEKVHVYDDWPRLDVSSIDKGSVIVFESRNGTDNWVTMVSLAKDLNCTRLMRRTYVDHICGGHDWRVHGGIECMPPYEDAHDDDVVVIDRSFDEPDEVPKHGTVIMSVPGCLCSKYLSPDYIFLRGASPYDAMHTAWLLQAFYTVDDAYYELANIRTPVKPWRTDRHLVLGPLTKEGHRPVYEYSCNMTVAELRDVKWPTS